jgi:hypothetical protein
MYCLLYYLICIIVVYILIIKYTQPGYYPYSPTLSFLYPNNERQAFMVYESNIHASELNKDFFYSVQQDYFTPILSLFKRSNIKNITIEDLKDYNKYKYSVNLLQIIINRPRPYKINKNIIPLSTISKSPSCPSTEAVILYKLAKDYSFKYPFIKRELYSLIDKICHVQIIAGIHYPSDNLLGKKIAYYL